jgi:hypothetical protein
MAALYQKSVRTPFNPAATPQQFIANRWTIAQQITLEFARNPTALPSADFQALQDQIIQRALSDPTVHFHRPEPIYVRQTPFQMSPPIFNVYDALAVVHTLLAELHGTEPWVQQAPR